MNSSGRILEGWSAYLLWYSWEDVESFELLQRWNHLALFLWSDSVSSLRGARQISI